MRTTKVFLAAAAALAMSSATVMAAGHSSGPAAVATEGAGSCTYVIKNMFAGPFDACSEPVDAANCDILANEAENSGGEHSTGACSTEGVIGTCTVDGLATHYYSGDAFGIEIGCGFQSGTYTSGE